MGKDLGLGVEVPGEVLGEVLVDLLGDILGMRRCVDGPGGAWGYNFTTF